MTSRVTRRGIRSNNGDALDAPSLSEVHSSDDKKDDIDDGEYRVASYINGMCSKREQQRIEHAWNMHGSKKGTRLADTHSSLNPAWMAPSGNHPS